MFVCCTYRTNACWHSSPVKGCSQVELVNQGSKQKICKSKFTTQRRNSKFNAEMKKYPILKRIYARSYVDVFPYGITLSLVGASRVSQVKQIDPRSRISEESSGTRLYANIVCVNNCICNPSVNVSMSILDINVFSSRYGNVNGNDFSMFISYGIGTWLSSGSPLERASTSLN